LVIGANGQLGSDIVRALHWEDVIPLTHQDIEIGEEAAVSGVMENHKPDVVVNTAAYHRVADCEKNDFASFKINSIGAKNLAIACKKSKIIIPHQARPFEK